MQGMHDSGAAGQSSTTYTAGTDTGGTSTTDEVTPNSDTALGTSESAFTSSPILAQGSAALTDAGMKVTSAGVTNADGSVTPASAFSSPAAMAAAGIDPAAIAESQKIIADVNSKGADGYKVSSVALDGGTGTGASSAVTDGSDNSINGRSVLGANGANRKLLAGKTVNFDGEPIGVRGDNIFDMVHVAYSKKREGKNFIETESGGPMVRRPASWPK
jgi:hypothetical protein